MPGSDATLTLYVENRGKLVNYAHSIVGDTERAEDVVQDAWFRLEQAMQSEQVRKPLNLLFTIVRNLSIDALRSAERIHQTSGGDIEEAAAIVADPQPSAEAGLIAREELTSVLDALQLMPARQRRAIELYRIEGYKLREIADELAISTSLAHVLIVEGLALCSALRAKVERLAK